MPKSKVSSKTLEPPPKKAKFIETKPAESNQAATIFATSKEPPPPTPGVSKILDNKTSDKLVEGKSGSSSRPRKSKAAVARIPSKIDSIISNLHIKGVKVHSDIPGYHRILTHKNIIVHSIMTKYDRKAHEKILECNKYMNPFKCLKTSRMGRKIVERPRNFVSQMTARNGDMLEAILLVKERKDPWPRRLFNLKSKSEFGYYEYFINRNLLYACEALDKGDEYIDNLR
ncbi:hypothetical protein H4219_003398 [Mycoemilia scoparia]|uniref:Uncharacterized protein n=1 Tax=Mycoemilia scoparia TaxID=417184 RepID=A0A9W8A1D7_9FUNG|nr:hypothetical protein H4219_003398 [Mycoemilia scoparia]